MPGALEASQAEWNSPVPAVELDKDYNPIRAVWRDPSNRRND